MLEIELKKKKLTRRISLYEFRILIQYGVVDDVFCLVILRYRTTLICLCTLQLYKNICQALIKTSRISNSRHLQIIIIIINKTRKLIQPQ